MSRTSLAWPTPAIVHPGNARCTSVSAERSTCRRGPVRIWKVYRSSLVDPRKQRKPVVETMCFFSISPVRLGRTMETSPWVWMATPFFSKHPIHHAHCGSVAPPGDGTDPNTPGMDGMKWMSGGSAQTHLHCERDLFLLLNSTQTPRHHLFGTAFWLDTLG